MLSGNGKVEETLSKGRDHECINIHGKQQNNDF